MANIDKVLMQNTEAATGDVLEKAVHKNFENFTRKKLVFSWSVFLMKFVKKRLQHRCFPVKFLKIL